MRFFFSLLLFFSVLCHAAERPVHHDAIMNHVFYHLKDQGTVCRDKYGYVYLKVDPGYIEELLSLIQDEGFENPSHAYGPHITLFDPKESLVPYFNDSGKEFPFVVTDCVIIAANRPDIESYCVLRVESKHLLDLRKKYQLGTPRHPLHITIGKKMKGADSAKAA